MAQFDISKNNNKTSKIHVSIKVENNEYIAFISEMAAIPSGMMDPTITNGTSRRTEIISAIDLLFTGF